MIDRNRKEEYKKREPGVSLFDDVADAVQEIFSPDCDTIVDTVCDIVNLD